MDPNFHVTSATFTHKFTKFSQTNKLIQSPACWIQNMPWKIFIEPIVRENRKYLSVFVSCAASVANSPWSCRASVRLYKLVGTRPKIISSTKFLVFDSLASTSWGHDNFILWDTVLNPANGFIHNDSITIEVIIDAEVPIGIKLTDKYYTDERATAAVKLYDQTISNLQSQIRELTNQNEQLKNTNKTSSEEIENLKNLLDDSEKKSADCEKKLKDKHDSNIKLQKLVDDSNNQLKQERENNDKLTETLNEKNTNIDTLTKNIQELGTIQKDLSNCRNQSDDAHKKYTALLDEFENYKRVITSTGSEGENQLKIEIDTMKNENVVLKKQFSEVQNELSDANIKLEQLEGLKNKVQELSNDKSKMLENVDSISTELSEAKAIIETIKKEAIEQQDKNRKQKDDGRTQIQSLKSQLYESLVKLQISQDMNEDIQKIKTEKNKLIEQMKIGYEKYNNLKQERITLNSQIENLNKQIADASKNIEDLKTETKTKQAEIEDCKSQLTISNSSISDLKKLNDDLKAAIEEANSKISSFENSNSEDLTNLVNEKNDLKNDNASLKSKLQSVEQELKEIKDKKMDDQVSRLSADKTELETKLNSVNKELQDTKVQLLNAQNDVDKMILFERNLSLLQSQFDATKNELKQLEDKKLDEAVSKLNEEKTSLQTLLSSLKQELEGTKAKLDNKQTEITKVKRLEDENVKLNEQISSLQNMLDETKSEIKTLNDRRNQNGNIEGQTHQNEDPNFGVDIVKGTGNGKKEPVQKLKASKTPRSSDQDMEDLGGITPKDSLELRLNNIRQQFEKQLKDADSATEIERKAMMKKIDDLLYDLREEKQKQEDLVANRKKLKGEICRLKEETNALRKAKEEICTQVRSGENISADSFQIIIDILKNLKASGKLSCAVEALIISHFNTIRQSKRFLSPENMPQSTEKFELLKTEISTDVLQEKLDQLQAHYEESLNIIRKNCVLELNENSRLRTANNELVVLIKNEMKITKQYKEMLKIANSRLKNFRKQFNELDYRLLDEKSRRFECEEMYNASKVFGEGTELMLDNLKEKLLRHAIKLSDIEDSELHGIDPVQTTDSNDDGHNSTCSTTETSSLTVGNSVDLSAKITNSPKQSTTNSPETPIPQELQSPTVDRDVENSEQNHRSNEKNENVLSSVSK